jgi:hypothetical protein
MHETTARAIAQSDSSVALQRIQKAASPQEAEAIAMTFVAHRAKECGARVKYLEKILKASPEGPLSRRLASRIVQITTLLERLKVTPEDYRSWLIWSAGESPKSPGFLPIFLIPLPDNEREQVLKAFHAKSQRSLQRSKAQDTALFKMDRLAPHDHRIGHTMLRHAQENYDVGDLENYAVQVNATRVFILSRSA